MSELASLFYRLQLSTFEFSFLFFFFHDHSMRWKDQLRHGSKSEDRTCFKILKKLLPLYFSSNFHDFFTTGLEKGWIFRKSILYQGYFHEKVSKIWDISQKKAKKRVFWGWIFFGACPKTLKSSLIPIDMMNSTI